jgi:hypothetical protein
MAHEAQKFGGLDLEYYDSILGPAQLESIAEDLVRRVPAKPGGDVLEIACGTAKNTWNRLQENPHARIAAEVMDEIFPGDPEMQLAKIPFGFHDETLIRSLLAAHHLRELRIEKVPIPIRCESVERYATGLVRGTPRALLIKERGRSLDEVIAVEAQAV